MSAIDKVERSVPGVSLVEIELVLWLSASWKITWPVAPAPARIFEPQLIAVMKPDRVIVTVAAAAELTTVVVLSL